MSEQPERVTVLRVKALDGENHFVSTNHESVPRFRFGYGGSSGSFWGHTLEVYQYPVENADARFAISLHHNSNSGSGSESFGLAREHNLDLKMFGIVTDGVELSSDLIVPEDLVLRHGRFENLYGSDCDRRLIVPLSAGRLSLGLSRADRFVPEPANG